MGNKDEFEEDRQKMVHINKYLVYLVGILTNKLF